MAQHLGITLYWAEREGRLTWIYAIQEIEGEAISLVAAFEQALHALIHPTG